MLYNHNTSSSSIIPQSLFIISGKPYEHGDNPHQGDSIHHLVIRHFVPKLVHLYLLALPSTGSCSSRRHYRSCCSAVSSHLHSSLQSRSIPQCTIPPGGSPPCNIVAKPPLLTTLTPAMGSSPAIPVPPFHTRGWVGVFVTLPISLIFQSC